MMPYTELAHGVWYLKGGMYRLVDALMEIAREAGVEFVFNTEVERIEVNQNLSHGVILDDGHQIKADVIIANADLPYVYKNLLPQDRTSKRIAKKRFSCSVISFFWGVDKQYKELGPHTLFLADDYRENFESIIDHLTLPDNPSLYVHAPARLDPAMAPKGQDTITAIVPVGHMDDSGKQDWKDIRLRARNAVFQRLALLGINDLEEHIKFEVCYTPRSWKKRYNLVKGSTHGLSHTLFQLGYFRPSNRHPWYHNLYFTGASTHPGTGAPTALVSGRQAATRILDDLGIHSSNG
jgi:phytoene desaturase